ncbi:MAG: endonuclease/exonuclease/phosphatase family protein [Candidatus Methylacidiphilales bacterium]|nr:endonuclease/exonuclease/phosphatase family protein [Candidatus Methylacidiphilales bacterium]
MHRSKSPAILPFHLTFFLLLAALLPAVAPAQDTYTIGLWNVQNFGVTDRFINDRPVKSAMKPESEIRTMVAILKRLNPDILGLVEILQDPEDKYVKLMQSTLKEAGLDYPHLSDCRGEDDRIQTLLLSKFPIVRTEHLTDATYKATFKDPKTQVTSEVQRKVERGINQSVIEVRPGLQVRVLLVHLKSKRPFPEIVSDQAEELGDGFVRRNEALILRGAMTRAVQANPDERLIAMGDFNDTPRSKAVGTILGPKSAEIRFYDLWLQDWLGDWWTHFYIPEKSYERLDYMVVSQKLFQDWKKEKSFVYRHNQTDGPEYNHYNASDHRPLLATFTVPVEGAEAREPAKKN